MTKNNKKFLNYTIIALLLILIIIFGVIFIGDKFENKDTDKAPEPTPPQVEETDKTEDEELDKSRFDGLLVTNENIGIPVLYYHSVDPSEANEVIISPDKLREQLQYIKDEGYTSLTMREVYDHLENNIEIPQKSILITFDDGYKDNYTNAFPILKELDMKATIFVITSGIDDGYYMDSAMLKEMADYGLDIESHTLNHKKLSELSYEEQLKELKDSKDFIENITGKEVLSVAYPFGSYNETTFKATKDAGYKMGFTTDRGLSDREDGSYKLDRIYVSSGYSMETFKDRLKNTQK